MKLYKSWTESQVLSHLRVHLIKIESTRDEALSGGGGAGFCTKRGKQSQPDFTPVIVPVPKIQLSLDGYLHKYM